MLKTARLLLRKARPGDLDDLHAIYGNARAMEFWSSPPDRTRDKTLERLERQLASEPPLTYFVLDLDGVAIGNAGMWRPYEIGFILHPDHWRKGYVREAMMAIVPHIWQVSDAPMLTADADPKNEASVGCLRALGFRETGTARNTYCVDGVWTDSVYFALPRPADQRARG
ncbi:GNAT family N-acetyltransferase [Pelagovum pacificum]|uniref:GNAT family N-acetyltransferase n=1 Tax=Pelagovum pacificum TaxID=2588711 RepID=A0A5C5GBV2_9RHOB|nr:GNAT family N-acetyltransferase [Pelagovum pacificum]QQA44603.1 GNAT family N-acetyltransferase [Pelagovum pacificum]TNY32285.1 GNAT family N-acetyltransferase [Pelagovum pacificum]